MNNSKTYSQETIAALIVSDKKKSQCTLIGTMPKNCYDIDIFQYFLRIFLECILCDTNDFKNIDLKIIDKKLLDQYKPHMNVLGCILQMEEVEKENIEKYNTYYCRIALKKVEENYFIIKNISSSYHFFFRSSYTEEQENELKLQDLYAIFNTKNNTVIKISFSFCNHSTHQLPIEKANHNINVGESF